MHTRTVLRESDFLVTVSGDLRTKAVAMGASPEKTRAIVNGCDLSVFHVRDRLEARQKLSIDPASEAVVYIGRMDVKKGLRELVEAAASLHPARPNMHVYMVGEGPDRPLIESAIQARNASGYIHALPTCAFDDVAVWMAAADLVTLPSYMEGCPNVVLEALACGRPVVATNVGGIPEIMSDECGRLVPPRDPVALAQALASVLDRSLGRSGHLRTREPKLEHRGGGTARDLRIARAHTIYNGLNLADWATLPRASGNPGEFLPSFRSWASSIYVRFEGLVTDLHEQLRAANIFVLPSHNEGFSTTIIEAMAPSLPIVATDVAETQRP